MTLTDEIQLAIKSNKTIFGYRKSIKFIKLDTPKMVIIAKNIPDGMRKEIENNAKISKVRVEVFDGTSKELGVVCGKPFSITTVAIKG